MSRCVCCDRMLIRTTGSRVLSSGEKVEETFCNVCRNEVNKILYSDNSFKFTQFEGILDQELRYGAVTPTRNPNY